jgi:putative oxidoreductase
MIHALISRFEPYALALMRIVAGFLFSLHGFQKVLGLLGGMRGTGAAAEFLSLAWVGGFLELAGGLLLMAGLFRRPVAFIVSGEMAVAYFMAHFPRGFWPILNGGELAALYAFVFLYLFAAPTDPWSLDRALFKPRKT